MQYVSSLGATLILAVAAVGAAADLSAPPYVAITVRGAVDDTITPGMPVRVIVRIEAPEDANERFLLAPASGTWVDAVAVELVPSGAVRPAIRAAPVGQPDTSSAELTGNRFASGLWRFSAADTQALRPGSYAVRARLAIASGTGWNGEVAADEVPLSVASTSDEPGNLSMRSLALAQDALVDGRNDAAAAALDSLLQSQPDNVDAWILRSVVSERVGNLFAALTCIRQAQLHYAALELDGPHIEIETIQERLLATLYTPNGTALPIPEDLPPWSWPPEDLLQQQETGTTLRAPTATIPSELSAIATADTTASVPSGPQPPSQVAASSPAAQAEPETAPGTIAPWDEADEAEILEDPNGQWASAATASTQYRPVDYSPQQATGAPDVPAYRDDPRSWTPSTSERQTEWLELSFAKPVHATEVRARQSFNPGTIVKLEAFAEDGTPHLLWSGTDSNAYPGNHIAWFVVRFPRTDYLVQRVRLTLDTPAAKGWKQIDAVQLVGSASD